MKFLVQLSFSRLCKLTEIISKLRHLEALINIRTLARSLDVDMPTFNFMYAGGCKVQGEVPLVLADGCIKYMWQL